MPKIKFYIDYKETLNLHSFQLDKVELSQSLGSSLDHTDERKDTRLFLSTKDLYLL